MNPFVQFLKTIGRYIGGFYHRSNLLDPTGKNPLWSDLSSIGTGVVDTVEGVTNKYTGSGLTPADRESWRLSEQSAQNQRAWEEQMSSTSYQRAVSDMRSAGLNPALMYGSGSGASTPSGAAGSAPSPSGAGLSELLGALLLPLQAKQLKADTASASASAKQKVADAEKSAAEADKIKLESAWIDRLNQANLESLQANKNLTESRVKEVESAIKVAEQEVKKKIAETASEEERKLLISAQRMLASASAREINALLPFKQALMAAQTDAASASAEASRAAAQLSLVQAAYNNHLIDSGYIDEMCRELTAKATSAEAKAAVDDLRSRMRTDGIFGDPINQFLDKYGIPSANTPIRILTNLVDMIPLTAKL